MKEIGIYNISALMLMIIGFDYNCGLELISRKKFIAASFKDRVEMLKIRFEKNLIDYGEEIKEKLENEVYSDEEQKGLLEEMLLISNAIEATCNKKKGKKPLNSVLFKCFLHNDSNPSMSWSAEQHGFYCFGCSKDNKVFDLFDYLKLIYGFDGPDAFKKSFMIAVEAYVEDSSKIENAFIERSNDRHTSYIPYSKEMNRVRHWTFHYPIEKDIPALKKLEERGISLATAKRMSVMTWYPTIDNSPIGLCYWIFLNDDGSYTRRLATINKNMNTGECARKWWNPSNKPMGIFNTRVLEHCRQFNEVCFVTESAIDALSCEELGYHSVGLNSINNLGKFFTEYVDKHPDTMLICLTDNDGVGKGAIVEFQKRNLYVADYEDWLSGFKDINEALMADRELSLKAMRNLEIAAKKFYGGLEND